MALVQVKLLYSCIPVGTQVCIKPALRDASVQCSLLSTTTRTSTPKKHVPSNIMTAANGAAANDSICWDHFPITC